MSDNIDKKSGLKLPSLVSDGMVLQRNRELKIWGWSDQNQKININFKGKEYLTEANSEGEWAINLPAQQAGGPFEMLIKTADEKIVIKDILIGEVWLCSGQSNMELPMQRVKDRYAEEIKRAANNQIREFKLPISYDFKEEKELIKGASWKQVSAATILDFSAVVYFFAKKLHGKYGVPVGILNASVGGSPVEAWMSREALKDYSEYLKQADKFADPETIKKAEKHNLEVNQKWAAKVNNNDQGLKNKPAYHDPTYNDSSWNQVEIPVKFDQINFENKNGVIWFRKKIELTKEQAEKEAKLWPGRGV
jgi:sialate O-acetylesterase